MVTISPAVQALLGIASLIITACAPIITTAALRHFRVARNSALGDDIYNAVQAASQLVLHELGVVAAHNQTLTIGNPALEKGIDEVLALAPLAAAHFELTRAKIAAYISGELAKALGVPADPPPAISPANISPDPASPAPISPAPISPPAI